MKPCFDWRTLDDLAGRRRWFLAFDRDGTLAPIGQSPSQSKIPGRVRHDLLALAAHPDTRVAVLSARGLPQLASELPADKLVLAGNYGLEVSFPDGRRIVNDSAGEARAALAEALSALKSRLPRAASAIVEDHGYSLCIHYHLTPAGLKQMLMDTVCDVARRACSLRLRSLPTSFEFLPDTDFSKADGLDVIVSHLCDDWSADAFFLYIGDSDQDEPAFHWVNCRGGLSIRVGGDPTAALSVLACAHSVADFIARLGRLRQTHMSPPDKGPC